MNQILQLRREVEQYGHLTSKTVHGSYHVKNVRVLLKRKRKKEREDAIWRDEAI